MKLIDTANPEKKIAARDPTKLPLIDSPIMGIIQIGRVAVIKGKFDRLAENEKREAEHQVKRLDRHCLKPLTPSSAKKGN